MTWSRAAGVTGSADAVAEMGGGSAVRIAAERLAGLVPWKALRPVRIS